MIAMSDNRTTELRISEPLRGFIRHQSNRAYIDGGQARWLTEIADEIDAKYEQAVDDARIVEVETSYIDIEQGEVITRFVPEQAIAATLGSDKPPYDELLRCLENDWHIYASWDGLRKFWCIELTEEGVRMRDARAERTCEMELTELSSGSAYHDVWLCSACGEQVEQHTVMGKSEPPRYCPNCGARVVDA